MNKARGLSLATNGGDSVCLVKKMPYSEVDYNRFMETEGVILATLTASVRSSLEKNGAVLEHYKSNDTAPRQEAKTERVIVHMSSSCPDQQNALQFHLIIPSLLFMMKSLSTLVYIVSLMTTI